MSRRPATSSATPRACGRSRTTGRQSARSAASRSRRSTGTSPASSTARRRPIPGIKTLNGYSNDFVKQAKCKETALNQIAQGSVVEFQVAGQCGLGVLDASHEKGIFGIGVDADQGYLGSWVMTSALKRVDVAVYNAIQAANHGTLAGGTNKQFGADIGGVGYGKWSSKVPASIKSAVAAQFAKLKAGKIKGIPTTVK